MWSLKVSIIRFENLPSPTYPLSPQMVIGLENKQFLHWEMFY
uniref:Uncharacterized protein n=1 Tax=Anguilla anguilla TaxID=7936 RepID=A0A0E9W6A4_ANGAN